MKVLHILNSLMSSGAEVMLRVAAPLLRDDGIEAEILTVGEFTGPYARTLADAGYAIHHLPFSKTPGFFRSLYELLGNYDVVHIHTERANFYYALTARLAGVQRIVRTIHSVFPFTGLLGAKRKIQRQLLKVLGCIQISVSKSVTICEAEYFGNRTVQISNWYDSSHFTPPTIAQRQAAREKLKIATDAFVAVSVGNCSRTKNHIELLNAIALDGRTSYLHVGDEAGGDEKQIAIQLGVNDRTQFIGAASDVREYLHAADVFVMPSLHEGCGIAAIEAMACGLPVILSDVPGLEDYKEISNDIIWTKPEAAEIAEALAIAARLDGRERASICRRLHDAVSAKFDTRRGVAAYAQIYRSQSKTARPLSLTLSVACK